MLKSVKTIDTGYLGSYTDLSQKTIVVKHSVVINNEPQNEREQRIVKELCQVFSRKAIE